MGKLFNPVVTELRKRNEVGVYTNYPIGAELKHIYPMRNSSNNNLEEEMIIGTDKITKSWFDSEVGALREVIEYRKSNVLNGYYQLDILKYKIGTEGGVSEIRQTNEILTFVTSTMDNSETSGTGATVQVDGEDIYFEDELSMFGNSLIQNEDSKGLHYSEEKSALIISPEVILEVDKLYWKDSNGTDILISTKKVNEYYDGDGNLIVSEVIEKNE